MMPQSWKGNLIQALCLQRDGRAAESREYLTMAQAVDPDGQLASTLLGEEVAAPWGPATLPPVDEANVALWYEAIARHRERKATPVLSATDLGWIWEDEGEPESDSENENP